MSYKLEIRKQIAEFVGQQKTSEILKIFKNKNVSRSTILRTIRDVKKGEEIINKPKSGRPRALNKKKRQNLVEMAKNSVDKSSRKLGRKFGISHMTAHRILKENSIKYRKRQKKPKYNNKQLQKIPKCCRMLRRKYLSDKCVLIMDDEKYFTFSNSTLTENSGFYTDDIDSCPDNVKYTFKEKFEPKILVWAAISERGISQLFIAPRKGYAIDTQTYIDKCLSKLAKFIEEKRKNEKIVFWPDLTPYHYSKKTLEWLKVKNINFVEKVNNPPHVPQASPVERFWAILNKIMYRNGWKAKYDDQLWRRI